MWSMDYVQVPAEDEETHEAPVENERKQQPSTEHDRHESTKKRVHELVKQMSISAEGSGIALRFFALNINWRRILPILVRVLIEIKCF